MAAVKLETRNEGRGLREWDYVPLSEPRVVSKLIQERSRLDDSYLPLRYESKNCLMSNGVFQFSEPVLAVYIDLDRLIEEAVLSKEEKAVVNWLMAGYEINDIAEHRGCWPENIQLLLDRAVYKICKRENELWEEVWSSAPMKTKMSR